MKVKELMQHLEGVNPEAEVMIGIQCYECGEELCTKSIFYGTFKAEEGDKTRHRFFEFYNEESTEEDKKNATHVGITDD